MKKAKVKINDKTVKIWAEAGINNSVHIKCSLENIEGVYYLARIEAGGISLYYGVPSDFPFALDEAARLELLNRDGLS